MLRSLSRFVFVAALVCTPAYGQTQSNADGAAANYSIETGSLGGAKFAIARPLAWNRRVLLLAHRERPADRPLRADLDPTQLSRETLLAEGWLIAATSFRRNGLIVADAIADLDALRDYIGEHYGDPERVLLEGEAMGGLIVTLMAERDPAEPKRYHGAVAIGATLQVTEPNATLGVALHPKLPLLFLANHIELEAFRHYIEANSMPESPGVRPTLFQVSRDGHANVNQRERLLALRALNLWLDHGHAALPRPAAGQRYFDATIPPEPQPSQVDLHADRRGFDARIVAISPDTGDLTLTAQPADFATIGLGKTARFQLRIGNETRRATYVRNLTRATKRGEWVAYANADGFFVLGRHRENAAETARVSAGDSVTIRRFDPAGK